MYLVCRRGKSMLVFFSASWTTVHSIRWGKSVNALLHAFNSQAINTIRTIWGKILGCSAWMIQLRKWTNWHTAGKGHFSFWNVQQQKDVLVWPMRPLILPCAHRHGLYSITGLRPTKGPLQSVQDLGQRLSPGLDNKPPPCVCLIIM